MDLQFDFGQDQMNNIRKQISLILLNREIHDAESGHRADVQPESSIDGDGSFEKTNGHSYSDCMDETCVLCNSYFSNLNSALNVIQPVKFNIYENKPGKLTSFNYNMKQRTVIDKINSNWEYVVIIDLCQLFQTLFLTTCYASCL